MKGQVLKALWGTGGVRLLAGDILLVLAISVVAWSLLPLSGSGGAAPSFAEIEVSGRRDARLAVSENLDGDDRILGSRRDIQDFIEVRQQTDFHVFRSTISRPADVVRRHSTAARVVVFARIVRRAVPEGIGHALERIAVAIGERNPRRKAESRRGVVRRLVP